MSFPLIFQNKITVFFIGTDKFKIRNIRIHKQRLAVLVCHRGSNHEAEFIHNPGSLKCAVDYIKIQAADLFACNNFALPIEDTAKLHDVGITELD